jgi:hypothetical protein
MATQPRRKLNMGTIIDRVVEVVSQNVVAGVIFIVVFAGLGILTDRLAAGAPIRAALFGIIVALATIIGVYLLTQTMLNKAGLQSYLGSPRILAYLGMGIIVGLATSLGLILFIIPGLILMARWSISGALLVGEGKGVTQSLGESWEATRGSEMPIILTFVVLVFSFTIVSVVAGLYAPTAGVGATVVSKIAGAVGNVLSTACGVAIYGLLTGGQNAAETFK